MPSIILKIKTCIIIHFCGHTLGQLSISVECLQWDTVMYAMCSVYAVHYGTCTCRSTIHIHCKTYIFKLLIKDHLSMFYERIFHFFLLQMFMFNSMLLAVSL